MARAGAMARSALVAVQAAAALAAESGASVQMLTGAHGVPEAPPRYDCRAEYDTWETAWTPDWKAWCCENELRGCPSTTTTTATSSTATSTTRTTTTRTTTTTEGLGCAALCEVDGVNATCGDRIRWATTHDDKDAKEPCVAAHTLVLSQCDICGGCSLEAAKCESKREERQEEKKERTFMFRKYEVLGQAAAPGAAQPSAPLGFFARCSLAGLVAGVPLAIVFRRSLRHTASVGQAGLGEQLYQRAVAEGDEAAAEAAANE